MGAMVAGRRMFDIANAWQGRPPSGGGPCLIVTHEPPREWLGAGLPFTFVADGVASAVRQAQLAAGDREVYGGPNVKHNLWTSFPYGCLHHPTEMFDSGAWGVGGAEPPRPGRLSTAYAQKNRGSSIDADQPR